ncbi:THAP domain-containing protein 11 [Elysia marginata]|uniref:THAP domain-containing protein 11 n=1 Tax=Elysia marginata TaxID=1093978 RepID=A0AAV4J221_9GAST|nr:THAP domain-containing protein 11 [Elysia marginata]
MCKKYCCVTGCHHKSGDDEIRLARIPKNKKIRKIWLDRIGRRNFVPNEQTKLCSAHFVGGYLSQDDLPSKFPHKTYQTTKTWKSHPPASTPPTTKTSEDMICLSRSRHALPMIQEWAAWASVLYSLWLVQVRRMVHGLIVEPCRQFRAITKRRSIQQVIHGT